MRKIICALIAFNSLVYSINDANDSNSFSDIMKERREKIKSEKIKFEEFTEGNHSIKLIGKRKYIYVPLRIKQRDKNGKIIESNLNIGSFAPKKRKEDSFVKIIHSTPRRTYNKNKTNFTIIEELESKKSSSNYKFINLSDINKTFKEIKEVKR